jgi:hypothetical protein
MQEVMGGVLIASGAIKIIKHRNQARVDCSEHTGVGL